MAARQIFPFGRSNLPDARLPDRIAARFAAHLAGIIDGPSLAPSGRGKHAGRRSKDRVRVMSLSSINGSSNARAFLQSLLQRQGAERGKAAGSADPMTALLNVFYPGGADSQTTSGGQASASTASAPCTSAAAMSPDTMAQLIAAQEERHGSAGDRIAARAESLFGRMDASQDGQIDQTEFENVFGAGADMSKVDGLFNALDTDGSGAISQDELTAAAQESHACHRHHHGHSHGGGLADMLTAATQGPTTQTSTHADSSTTTTISYAAGSNVTMTLPAGSAGASN